MELPNPVSTVLETELAAYEPIKRVTEGDRHETFVVVDDAETRYILKVYADGRQGQGESGYEAPVVTSIQGFEFVPGLHQSGVAGSYPYIVFERVENTERWGTPAWERKVARTLGETLSRVHTEIEAADSWGQSSETYPAPERLAPSVLFDTLSELQQAPHRRLPGILPAVADALRETVPESGVIHGDVTVDNVRFATETCVLVDWETAGRSDVCFDVSKAELWVFQLFEPLLSMSTEAVLSEFREAYGVSPLAVKRIRALKILLLCRMAARVDRLGPYESWQHRVDGSCLGRVLTVLERTMRDAAFIDTDPESSLPKRRLSGTATER